MIITWSALALTAAGCQDATGGDAAADGACDLLGDGLVTMVTGETAHTVADDTLARGGDDTTSRCDLEADDDFGFLRIKASHPADDVVIAENVRRQLADPDSQEQLVEPCTEHDGDPGVGIDCSISRPVGGQQETYVYVHREDTSISVKLSQWPADAAPGERLSLARTVTNQFVTSLAESRAEG